MCVCKCVLHLLECVFAIQNYGDQSMEQTYRVMMVHAPCADISLRFNSIWKFSSLLSVTFVITAPNLNIFPMFAHINDHTYAH